MSEIQLLKQKGWEVTCSDDFSTFPVIEAVNQGFVYALEYGKYIKIGKTQNLTERMKSLISQAKIYSMTNTGLVAYTVAHSNYSENELLLHSEFENKRVENGELFAMNLKYFAKFVSKLSFESKEPENNEDILIKITKNFSKNLLKMRKKSGLTQTKLANLLDIPLRTVRRWESGTQIPRVKDMPRLCNVLNCKELISRY